MTRVDLGSAISSSPRKPQEHSSTATRTPGGPVAGRMAHHLKHAIDDRFDAAKWVGGGQFGRGRSNAAGVGVTQERSLPSFDGVETGQTGHAASDQRTQPVQEAQGATARPGIACNRTTVAHSRTFGRARKSHWFGTGEQTPPFAVARSRCNVTGARRQARCAGTAGTTSRRSTSKGTAKCCQGAASERTFLVVLSTGGCGRAAGRTWACQNNTVEPRSHAVERSDGERWTAGQGRAHLASLGRRHARRAVSTPPPAKLIVGYVTTPAV